MKTIVIFSIILITFIHSLLIPFRKSGTLKSETTYDFFSFIMYASIFANLILFYQWWGLGITIFLIIIEHYLSSPSKYISERFNLLPEEIALTFFVLSWINLLVTIIHFAYSLFG